MKKKGSQKGFTLLELLVAVAILAVVVVPILNAFLTSVNINAKAKDKQRATIAAGNVMEDIKSKSAEELFSDASFKKKGERYEKTQVEIVDKQAYTVVSTLDASQKTKQSENAFDEATDYNEEELSHLFSVSSLYDAIYVQNGEQDMEYARALKNSTSTDATVLSWIKRTTNISVKKESDEYKVYLQTTYSYANNGNIQEKSTPQELLFSGEQQPRNIFIFFQPMYNGDLNNIREYFFIDNTELIPTNVYLVRQNEDTLKESTYLAQVRCFEGKRNDCRTNRITKILSNLNEGTKGKKGLFLTYAMGDKAEDITEQQWNTATYYEGMSAADILQFRDLGNKSAEAWAYRVSVSAYKGQGDKRENESLVTFETTITKE